MATATAAQRRDVKEYIFVWEGFDRNNRQVRGETRAASETVVTTNLRRQGIRVTKVKKQTFRGGRRVNEKDVTFFTRQLATMLRAGVPLLQAFDIVARGHNNARFSRLMLDIKGRIESGSSLSQAFREHPVQFDNLYCNLVSAGETSGMLDAILDRLATYKEKILAIKGKIKAALFYPISVIVVAIVVVWVIMIWVIPAFKQVFTSFGADLPAPTLFVMAIDKVLRYDHLSRDDLLRWHRILAAQGWIRVTDRGPGQLPGEKLAHLRRHLGQSFLLTAVLGLPGRGAVTRPSTRRSSAAPQTRASAGRRYTRS